PTPLDAVIVDMKEKWTLKSVEPRVVTLEFQVDGRRFGCDAFKSENDWSLIEVRRNGETVFTK
ncbi:MAG: hypothetical protein AAGJ85_03700, partial [Pseudomonadota bacterium]